MVSGLVTVMVVVWRHELGADWTPGNVNGERFVFIQNVFSLIYILQIKGCWDIMALKLSRCFICLLVYGFKPLALEQLGSCIK